jgi:di/tripeptidase
LTPSATFRWIGITSFVLAVAGSATAQPASVAPAADAQVGFQRRVQLSPQDEITEANAAVMRMEQASAMVRRQLEQARAARDVVKTLCLNDKLSQIDVTTRSARDRQAALVSSVARNDVEGANHHFSILTAHRQHAEQVTAEANQCVGEEVAFVGQTQVTSEVDELLPGEDDVEYTDPTVISYTPLPVSPTH